MIRAPFLGRGLVYFFLSAIALLTVCPFLLVLVTSLKTMDDIHKRGPMAFPETLHWHNYVDIWKVGNFLLYFQNSVVVTVVVVASVVVLALIASYPFAYMKFRGKGFLFLIILLGLMVPLDLIIIPLFHNLKSIGLLNTLWAIILPQIALSLPFSIFLLRGFMKDIPAALLESARIDGSNELQNLLYIIIPMLYPPLVSVIVFNALGTWNNFMLPTILVQQDHLRTLPVGLNYFQTKYTMDYSKIATAAVISALPTIAVYVLFQRNITTGMMVGALKE
jgi:raffinose/stachyose/melibiose transport system permease protein